MREIYARAQAELIDAMMCLMLNRLQSLGRREVIHPLDLERYVGECNGLSQIEFYALEPMQKVRETSHSLRWSSPVKTSFPENATAHARLFLSGAGGWSAPTVIFLHALMSASDFDYQQIAHRFNANVWNPIFPHLPFHYSPLPPAHSTATLPLTPTLPRTRTP